jgi:hypothetical protein
MMREAPHMTLMAAAGVSTEAVGFSSFRMIDLTYKTWRLERFELLICSLGIGIEKT